MKQASLFCMPSRFEAYGLVFAEALISGTPCIGRNAFEMPFFIDKAITGELLDGDDREALADFINKILANPAYKKNVEERKRFYMDKYNWKAVSSFVSRTITS